MNDAVRVNEHLQDALDHVLAALVISGGLAQEVPGEALDATIQNDPAVKDARQAHHDALRALKGAGVPREAILLVEEATNALVARGAEAAYRLGMRVGRGGR